MSKSALPKPLSVIRYSLEGRPGPCNPVSLPESLIEGALENFFEIERRINGLWRPETLKPIEIPDKPNQYYYKNFALQFTRSYFFKNLLKCLICNEILRYHIGGIEKFVDIGAGSGPFSVALAQSFEPSTLELLDCSEAQLGIAELVLEKWRSISDISYCCMNVTDFDALGKDCVASYAMGEFTQNRVDVLKTIRESNTFTLIDSPLVVRGVRSYLESCDLPAISGYITFSIEGNLKQLVEGGGGHFCFLHKKSSSNLKQNATVKL
jgi:hypothetical protein